MIITRTPFRISLFGGGTDLPAYYRQHGGAVLSTTIDKYLYISCRRMPPYWDFKHRLVYGSGCEQVKELQEIRHPSIRETLRFLQIPYGIDMHYNTDIPARSGIGSSSAFTVGLLNALYGLEGRMVSKRRLASEAIHIEQDMIGEAVGSQDQIAAAFGGLNYIEFHSNGSFSVRPVTITRERRQELQERLVLVFTGFQRFAVDVEQDKIQKVGERTSELARISQLTEQALQILSSNRDLSELGWLLDESWRLKKALSDKVSTAMIDELYETGRRNGALGGKLIGAGGGGFMLFFCEPCAREQLLHSMQGHVQVPFALEPNGSQVIYYRER